MAIPSAVYRMSQEKIASMITATAIVMRLRTGVMTPANSTVREKSSGNGTARGLGEMKRSAAFCSRVEKAKDVMRTAVTDLARTGRKAR